MVVRCGQSQNDAAAPRARSLDTDVSEPRSILNPAPKTTGTDHPQVIDATVVLLTHYLPLYQVRVFQELSRRVRSLKILLSTPCEPNRNFGLDWGGLDVTVQKSWMLRRRWKHHIGFDDQLFLHIPYDTLAQLRKHRPDVILSHELGARSMIAAMYRRLCPQSRLVLMTYMSEHTEQGRGKLRGAVRRKLLAAADAVTFNGPSCRRYLATNGVEARKLFPMPYAADDRIPVDSEPQRDESQVRGRLICVGQINQRKGVIPMVHQLVDYCLARPNRSIDLKIVGDGPQRGELLAIKRPKNFHLQSIPNLTPMELAALYRDCGAAIHPTLADEWLMVVDESLRSGLPMIGSRYAQAVETLVRDGVNGWSFDPVVAGDLAEKLDCYFQHSDGAIAAMRVAARKSVVDRTPESSVDGAVAAIRWVMQQRRK
jgi:glycosyltransferase involved in cell wall biosynthesis